MIVEDNFEVWGREEGIRKEDKEPRIYNIYHKSVYVCV